MQNYNTKAQWHCRCYQRLPVRSSTVSGKRCPKLIWRDNFRCFDFFSACFCSFRRPWSIFSRPPIIPTPHVFHTWVWVCAHADWLSLRGNQRMCDSKLRFIITWAYLRTCKLIAQFKIWALNQAALLGDVASPPVNLHPMLSATISRKVGCIAIIS